MNTRTVGKIWGVGKSGPVAAVMLLLAMSCPNASGEEGMGVAERQRAYIRIFGGGGCMNINSIHQEGTALFPDSRGGVLDVNAFGSSNNGGIGVAGMTIGHEWSGRSVGGEGSGWLLLPAAEMEGFYMGGTQRTNLADLTNRLDEHNFLDTFPLNNAVFMTNAVFNLHNSDAIFSPYIGGGIGAACVSISGANSTQTDPFEPNINHFNSNPNSSAWGFAAQVKVGLEIPLGERCYLFSEYRCLYIGSTTQTFGSTQYPTHVATTPWRVHFADMVSHLGIGGIGFRF